MDNRKVTFEEVLAMFAESRDLIDRLSIKSDKKSAEIDRKFEETRDLIDRLNIESDKKFAETKELFEKLSIGTDKKFAETKQLFDKLGIKADDINSRLEGISKSNGKFAEEYFFNSLEEKKEFAGIHFDYISDTFKTLKKMPDGSKLEDQFDIVMVNDKAVAIIEVKYRADRDYPKEMATRKVKNFRILFPDYKNFDIYLGLGSMSFDNCVVKKAKEYGVGLLKQVGNVIEYKTDWVRPY